MNSERFKYLWQLHLGWMPVQFCMTCGKAYWGGLPRWWIIDGKITNTWQARWSDYCSQKCCDEDHDSHIA